jgi:cytochrome c
MAFDFRYLALAALAATGMSAAPALAQAAKPAAPAAAPAFSTLKGNAAAGEKIFAQCKACHVTDKGVNKVGPSLHAIVGRKAGTVAGFNYSTANKNSGVTWTPEVMYTYLENPRKFMPGTKMAFAGLRQPQQRADVIAYLQQFK